MITLIGVLLYIVLYLLGAVVSFFALAKIMKYKSHQAGSLIMVSLFFPLVWAILIPLSAWFKLQEYAEKYLEKINEGNDE